jgi:uncharacterized membrane protein
MILPSLTRSFMMLLTCGLLSMSAQAQSRGPATLSAAERDAALKAIVSAFEKQCVFPEMRPRIIERLKASHRASPS